MSELEAMHWYENLVMHQGEHPSMSLPVLTDVLRQSTRDAEAARVRRLLQNSAISEIMECILGFLGLRMSPSLDGFGDRNAVSGKTVAEPFEQTAMRVALTSALKSLVMDASRTLHCASPLDRPLLWFANYLWVCTQKFGGSDQLRKKQTIDGLPESKGGQSDLRWWNTVLPRSIK